MAKTNKKSPKKRLLKRVLKKRARKTPARKKIVRRKAVDPLKKKETSSAQIPILESIFHKTKIRVIGIGGGGSSIVEEIASRVSRANFVVANTDQKALRAASSGVIKFQFGQGLTKGLGTGMNVELGEMVAQHEKEKIQKLFEGQDLSILVSCLGGGTGSGATPTFAKLAKTLGNLTYGIFTLPFEFEGARKMETALNALEKIKPHLNAYSVIPNERIFQLIDKETPLRDALSAINRKLAENLQGLIEMIYLPGLINIDFADLRTILGGYGRLTYLQASELAMPLRDEEIHKAFFTPLYPYPMKGARGILYTITGGKDLQLAHVSHVSQVIAGSVNRAAKIIFGITQNQKFQNKTKITVLATGCPAKAPFLQQGSVKVGGFPIDRAREKRVSKKRPKHNIVHRTIGKIVKLTTSKSAQIKNKKSKVRKKVLPRAKKIAVVVSGKKKTLLTSAQGASVQSPNVGKELSEEQGGTKEKIRRTALEVHRDIEEVEKELLAEEKKWETPAIFRKNQDQLP